MTFYGPTKEWNTDMSHVMGVSGAQDAEKSQKLPSSNSLKPPQTPKEDESAEKLKRQVGDTTVWRYYAKAIGAWHIFFQALFTTMYVLGSSFPREYTTLPRILVRPA